ncbi:MAG: EamA family transporter [Eubacterium sp.]
MTVLNYIWPILIVVTANTFYNICAKSTPQNVQPFAALAVTYLFATIVSVIFYFLTSETKNLFMDIKGVNWASFVLGVSVVALEFGYIQVYRVGWDVSIGSLVANIGLAVILVFVGVFVYKEVITVNQMIGIVLCMAGIVFLNR